ncbi:MAG: hypothetical protein R3233_09960 [Xanthomonadales bacterium]|nr:hypothetical protein [Xanthomonadales bacterium]
MKTGTLLAIIVFVLVALAHLARLIDRTEILVGTMVLPLWASVLGVVVPGLIAWLLWKESR